MSGTFFFYFLLSLFLSLFLLDKKYHTLLQFPSSTYYFIAIQDLPSNLPYAFLYFFIIYIYLFFFCFCSPATLLLVLTLVSTIIYLLIFLYFFSQIKIFRHDSQKLEKETTEKNGIKCFCYDRYDVSTRICY